MKMRLLKIWILFGLGIVTCRTEEDNVEMELGRPGQEEENGDSPQESILDILKPKLDDIVSKKIADMVRITKSVFERI